MRIWDSITGMMEVEITSADPEKCLDAFRAANIALSDIQRLSDLTCSVRINRNSYPMACGICRKHGDTVRLKRKLGLFWLAGKAVSRPLLLGGSLLFFLLALYLPSRVFFIRVEGNSGIPERRILAAAEECGIAFGASRREVRSERVKNALLCAVPELQWAGINTSGCTATISVREKTEKEEKKKTESISSILASRDGYVLSATATAGNLLVKPGDSVRKGQVLISAYTDCGLCIRAERAEGEIMAQTSRKLEAIMPSQVIVKGEIRQVKRKVSLLARKKRIFLWKDSGIWEGSCGRMYEEYYITLPGGFRLPVALCVETYTICQTSTMDIPEETVKTDLKAFAQDYLSRNMVAGKIVGGTQRVTMKDGRCTLTGDYICEEMISAVRQEQIGDTNGENS